MVENVRADMLVPLRAQVSFTGPGAPLPGEVNPVDTGAAESVELPSSSLGRLAKSVTSYQW